MLLKFEDKILNKDCKITYFYNGTVNLEFELFENEVVKCEEVFTISGENKFIVKLVDGNVASAELDFTDLKKDIYKGNVNFESQTLNDTLHQLLDNYGWQIANAQSVNLRRTLKIEDESVISAVFKCEKLYNCTFNFDCINKIIKVVNEPNSKDYIISYNVNLLNFDIKADTYEHYTRIYGYGKDGLNFSSVNNGVDYVENLDYNSNIISVIFRDDRFTDPVSLKEHCEELLSEHSRPLIEYNLKVLELQDVNLKLHDEIIFLNKQTKRKEKHRIIEFVRYTDSPTKNEIKLINRSENLTTYLTTFKEELSSEITKEISKIDFSTRFDESLKRVNERFENLLINGYKIETENATYYVDKLPKESAVNVLKIGLGGIMGSSNGWNGNFELAISNNGEINADRILTGYLDVDRIKANSITADKLHVTAREEITRGLVTETNFQVLSGKITSSVEEVKEKLNSVDTKEIEKKLSTIRQTQDSISHEVASWKSDQLAKNELVDSEINRVANELSRITQKSDEIDISVRKFLKGEDTFETEDICTDGKSKKTGNSITFNTSKTMETNKNYDVEVDIESADDISKIRLEGYNGSFIKGLNKIKFSGNGKKTLKFTAGTRARVVSGTEREISRSTSRQSGHDLKFYLNENLKTNKDYTIKFNVDSADDISKARFDGKNIRNGANTFTIRPENTNNYFSFNGGSRTETTSTTQLVNIARASSGSGNSITFPLSENLSSSTTYEMEFNLTDVSDVSKLTCNVFNGRFKQGLNKFSFTPTKSTNSIVFNAGNIVENVVGRNITLDVENALSYFKITLKSTIPPQKIAKVYIDNNTGLKDMDLFSYDVDILSKKVNDGKVLIVIKNKSKSNELRSVTFGFSGFKFLRIKNYDVSVFLEGEETGIVEKNLTVNINNFSFKTNKRISTNSSVPLNLSVSNFSCKYTSDNSTVYDNLNASIKTCKVINKEIVQSGFVKKTDYDREMASLKVKSNEINLKIESTEAILGKNIAFDGHLTKNGNDIYYDATETFKANTEYVVEFNLLSSSSPEKVKIHGNKLSNAPCKIGKNILKLKYSSEQTRLNFYPVSSNGSIKDVKIYKADSVIGVKGDLADVRGEIDGKISDKVSKDNIISEINLSREGVKIKGSKIEVTGDMFVEGALSAYRGQLGDFYIGKMGWRSGQWITSYDFQVGMGTGDRNAVLWANWGSDWERMGARTWMVNRNGKMFAYNGMEVKEQSDFNGEVNFLGNTYFSREISARYGGIDVGSSDVYGNGTHPRGGRNATVWWSQRSSFISSSSDERLKENIQKTEVNALETIKKINLVQYDWKKDGIHEKIGAIAQELEKIIPEAVNITHDDFKGIDYIKLIPYLLKAVQELSVENQNLKEMLKKMEVKDV